jgi:hypothetical protein
MLSIRLITVKKRIFASWESSLDEKARKRSSQRWSKKDLSITLVSFKSRDEDEDSIPFSRYVPLTRLLKSTPRHELLKNRNKRRRLSERLRLRGEWGG